jgi:putative acyl-CoA dehydrogenase
MATHEVTNQPPPLPDLDLYTTDPVLHSAVVREGAGWAQSLLSEFGSVVGSERVAELGFLANRNEPILRSHDRYGNRIDTVEYHPAWHELMHLSVSAGVHSFSWEGDEIGRHVARTALMYLDSQVEQGHGCPISMTSSALPALRTQPDIAAMWENGILSRAYDPSFAPATAKHGLLMGMGMTEKQGGSDVRANSTSAIPVNGGGPGGDYRMTGHKWFTSAPMCDAFLVLGQAPGGLSCFLLPRWSPEGSSNAFHIQRLKDKLGNRSNASCEVEFAGAHAVLIGEEGRGVPTIVEMVNGTRLDCVIGAAAIMRQAVTQAAHHVTHRRAFGSTLLEKPLMRNVIADLEVEAEAAALLMMRLAGAFDRAAGDDQEEQLKRILTPVAKFWIAKRCTGVVHEALECLGGNGYVEDSIMPRLFRESPLNAIWEGSGNVIALDVLRVLNKQPEAYEALRAEMGTVRGSDPRLDRLLDEADTAVKAVADPEWEARRLTSLLATAVTASLVVRHGSRELAGAYLASRLGEGPGRGYGSLPSGTGIEGLLASANPFRRQPSGIT